MRRLSSNATLFWKMFFPVLYLTFFGLFGLAIINTDKDYLPIFASLQNRIIYFAAYCGMGLILYFTVMSLKRVEADDDSIIITNYFKTYKYSKNSVEKIKFYDFFIFELASITFKARTSFGRKVRFITTDGDIRGEFDVMKD